LPRWLRTTNTCFRSTDPRKKSARPARNRCSSDANPGLPTSPMSEEACRPGGACPRFSLLLPSTCSSPCRFESLPCTAKACAGVGLRLRLLLPSSFDPARGPVPCPLPAPAVEGTCSPRYRKARVGPSLWDRVPSRSPAPERWTMTPLEMNYLRPAAARAPSREALGELLELYRPYLLRIAHEHLDPKLATKGDAADLVQETFLEAYRDFGGFQGTSDADLRAWLRRLLMNNLTNFSRRFRDGGKRAVAREVSLEAGDPGCTTLVLASDASTPSGHAAAEEQAQQVRHALQCLPEDYRQVLHLRYRERRPFKEIARQMQRTPNAIRKLWSRALARLRG